MNTSQTDVFLIFYKAFKLKEDTDCTQPAADKNNSIGQFLIPVGSFTSHTARYMAKSYR